MIIKFDLRSKLFILYFVNISKHKEIEEGQYDYIARNYVS